MWIFLPYMKLCSKTSSKFYPQFTKTKLTFPGKVTSSGFNNNERQSVLNVPKLSEYNSWQNWLTFRSSPPDVFLGIVVLRLCRKCTGEHSCQSVISIELLCNFIKIILQQGCSLVSLVHIFRTPFYKNTSGGLFL